MDQFLNDNDSTKTEHELCLQPSAENFESICAIYNKSLRNEQDVEALFTSLGKFLVSITENDSTTNQELGMKVIDWILQNQKEALLRSISSKNASSTFVSSGLFLLSSMVSLHHDAAIETINCIEFKRINLEFLTKPRNSNCIRIGFLKLVVAFLESGTKSRKCLRQFLDLNGVLVSVFGGLSNDPDWLVIKFLNLLHYTIVKDMNISKTLKVKLFNRNSCGELMKLYRTTITLDWIEESVADKELIEAKRRALHSLMLTLCSDHRCGVIFKEKLNQDYKIDTNRHVSLILKAGDNLWDFEEGRELLRQTMKACPDVTNIYMKSFNNLDPKPVDNYFYSLLQMFVTFIDNSEPWTIFSSKAISEKIPFYTLLIPCLSNTDLTHLISGKPPVDILLHSGMTILKSIYFKAIETFKEIENMSEIDDSKKKFYKSIVKKSLFRLGGGQKCVLLCFESFIEANNNYRDNSQKYPLYAAEHKTKFALLSMMLQVYILYVKVHDYFSLRNQMNPSRMFKIFLQFSSQFIEKDPEQYNRCLLNVLRLFALGQEANDCDTLGFAEEKSGESCLDKKIFLELINVYCSQNAASKLPSHKEVQKLSLSILENCLKAQRVSTYSSPCLKLWLQNALLLDTTYCCQFIISVLVNCVKNDLIYVESLLEKIPTSTDIDVLEKVSNLSSEEKIIDSEQIPELKLPFSNLVISAVELLSKMDNKAYNDYFSNVMLHYIHCVFDSSVLLEYLCESDVVNDELVNYCKVISGSTKPSSDLLQGSFVDCSSYLRAIFLSQDYPSFHLVSQQWLSEDFNSYDALLLCYQLFLYMKVDKNDKKRVKFYLKVFNNIVSRNELKGDKFYEDLLLHPFMIDNYNPLSKSDPVTKSIENILLLVSNNSSLKPFFNKFLKSLSQVAVEELENLDLSSSLLSFTKNNRLSAQDTEALLASCLNLPLTDSVKNLLCSTLEVLLLSSSLVNASSLSQSLLSKLIELNQSEEEFDSLDQSAFNLLQKAVVKFMDSDFSQNLEQEKLKDLLNGQEFANSVCCCLIEHHLPHAVIITKKLKKDINLSSQLDYILTHSRLDRSNKQVLTYFNKVKEELTAWMYNKNSKFDLNYQNLIIAMIDNQLLESSEIIALCSYWSNDRLKKGKNVPDHLLCLVPLFKNCLNNDTEGAKEQMLLVCLSLLVKLYTKERDCETIRQLDQVLSDVLPSVDAEVLRAMFESSKLDDLWNSFVKQVLKLSLTDSDCGFRTIRCLEQMLTRIYSDECKVSLSLPTLHEMLRGHSQFFALLTNRETDFEALKESVIVLIQRVVEINSAGCSDRQIPLLLAAYGASRSSCDQNILKLLYWYETNGFMGSHSPIVWDHLALSHFALVWDSNQGPSASQCLAQINKDQVIATALNFDMDLPLEPLCVVDADPALYDQRFLLLSLVKLTSEPMVEVDALELASVAVPIGLAAFSSKHDEVWATGALVLKQTMTVLQNSSHKNLKLQWMWMITVIGYGLHEKQQRVSSLVLHFLIKSAEHFDQPEHKLYKVFFNYIFLKPAFSISQVPELLLMYFSVSVDLFMEHRVFLLRMLAAGVRDDLDIKLTDGCFVPKFVLNLLTSATATEQIKVLCLKAINSMLEIPMGFNSLVRVNSVVLHLPLVLSQRTECHNILLTTLQVLWSSAKKNLLNDVEKSTTKPLLLNEAEDSTKKRPLPEDKDTTKPRPPPEDKETIKPCPLPEDKDTTKSHPLLEAEGETKKRISEEESSSEQPPAKKAKTKPKKSVYHKSKVVLTTEFQQSFAAEFFACLKSLEGKMIVGLEEDERKNWKSLCEEVRLKFNQINA